MRIVAPKFPFDTFNGHPIIKARGGYLHFPNEQAVRDFWPVMTDVPPDTGYVVVVKAGFKRAARKGAHVLAEYVENSNAERIVLVDFRDTDALFPITPSMAERHVYLKLNLTELLSPEYVPEELRDAALNIYPYPQFPVERVLWDWMKKPLGLKPLRKRAYDVFFIGNFKRERRRRQRRESINELRAICGKWKLRAVIRNGRVPSRQYLEMMNDSLICFSPKGSGYRCRREWEILLAGSTLMLDNINLRHGLVLPDFEVNRHCVYCDPMETELLVLLRDQQRLMDLSEQGHTLARTCFIDHPLSLNERYIRVYLLNPRANIQRYADLERQERGLGLLL